MHLGSSQSSKKKNKCHLLKQIPYIYMNLKTISTKLFDNRYRSIKASSTAEKKAHGFFHYLVSVCGPLEML